jgi:carbon starvation protein CstA
VLFKMKRGKYAWVTVVPTIWLLICTLTAGWQKIFDANVRRSASWRTPKYQAALDQGKVLAPAKSPSTRCSRMIFNDYLDATLCGFFMFVVLSVLVFGIRTVLAARANKSKPTAKETPYVPATGGRPDDVRRRSPGRPLPRAKHAPDGRPARVRHLCQRTWRRPIPTSR